MGTIPVDPSSFIQSLPRKKKIVRFQLQMHARQKKERTGYGYVVGLTEAITCGRNGLDYDILEGVLYVNFCLGTNEEESIHEFT